MIFSMELFLHKIDSIISITTNIMEPQNRLFANFKDTMYQDAYNLKVATPRIERFKFRRI